MLEFVDYKRTLFKLYDIDSQTAETIHIEDGMIDSVAWGKHKDQIIFEQNDTNLFRLDLKTGKQNLFFRSGSFLGQISRGFNGQSFAFGSQHQADEEIFVGEINPSSDEGGELLWQQNSSLIDY